MMKKFNDIFSIDSSTGGGKRLIKNIINKYRLGNEYKEIKENIENKGSSGESSDTNVEYFKWSRGDFRNLLPIVAAWCDIILTTDGNKTILCGAYYTIYTPGTFDIAYVFRITFPIKMTIPDVGDVSFNNLIELSNFQNNFLQYCDIVTKEDFDRAYDELSIFNG